MESELGEAILAFALSLGFDRAGIVPVRRPEHGAAFADWLREGYHGEMGYLATRAAERLNPSAWLPDARSLIVLVANYNPGALPVQGLDAQRAQGRFARYAWATDYHDVIKLRLYALDAFIRERTGRMAQGKACVDSAPLLERDFAAQAGLGFIGRNTCLITSRLGSWTFLAALAVPEELVRTSGLRPNRNAAIGFEPVRQPPLGLGGQVRGRERPAEASSPELRAATLRANAHADCGRCTRCLDACPTQAFVAPHVLDARRCISYLTIELRGSIPHELRPLIGNWVFGCDVCQEVCPYNRCASRSQWSALAPDPRRAAPALVELLALDDAAFRARFRGTAILRTKRRGLVRNACVAAGNWGNPIVVPALAGLLVDSEPLVRGHAAWALGRIGGREATETLRKAQAAEQNPVVIRELDWALSQANAAMP